MEKTLAVVKILLSSLFLLLIITSAHSENRIDKLRATRGAEGYFFLDKLECFDQLSQDLLAQKVEPLNGKWQVTTETNPVNNSKTITLRLFSESADLVIRYKSGKTDLYIRWSDFINIEKTPVLTRLGTAPATQRYWNISTDHTATFFPRSLFRTTPPQFIKEIMKVDSFLAQVTPYGESPVTIIFDVRGLRNAIQPLREVAGW